MDKNTKELLEKYKNQEQELKKELENVENRLTHIQKEKEKIFIKIKLNSDEIECSYCGYMASKKENPEEAESYDYCIGRGLNWYCGQSGCY